MRILLYNFVQPEEPGAGGVGVYLKNLAEALARDHDVIVMSSGDRYSLTRQEARVEFSRDEYDRAVVFNSPVNAPATSNFGNPDAYLANRELDFIPRLLAERYGRIDVFHFQNIEGLTRSFFTELRTVFPEARILYSAHNYHPVCPNVGLWHQDRVVCEDYRDGAACTMCRARVSSPSYVRNRRRLMRVESALPWAKSISSPALKLAKRARQFVLRRRGGQAQAQAHMYGQAQSDVATPGAAPAASYAAFRKSNIDLFQNVFDQVLAVSKRTRDVMVARGVPAGRVAVSYIGTAHKAAYLTSSKISDIAEGLHLGYIGYMGTDKGFKFLLECLERMPTPMAAGITVTIAARNTSPERHAQMKRVASRYKQLRYFDGYTHDNLDQVLSGVNLGLIPVLWEDNLPQTAIELVSRGIPVLTSNRGGAQEIAEDENFVFRAGNHDSFIEHIGRINRRELDLGEFWTTDKRIFSMDEHVEDLMRFYRGSPLPAELVA